MQFSAQHLSLDTEFTMNWHFADIGVSNLWHGKITGILTGFTRGHPPRVSVQYTDGKNVYCEPFPPRHDVVVDNITLLPKGSIDFEPILEAQLTRERKEREEKKKVRVRQMPQIPPVVVSKQPDGQQERTAKDMAAKGISKVKKRRVLKQVLDCPHCGQQITVSFK
jgi:hypothetical protein